MFPYSSLSLAFSIEAECLGEPSPLAKGIVLVTTTLENMRNDQLSPYSLPLSLSLSLSLSLCFRIYYTYYVILYMYIYIYMRGM